MTKESSRRWVIILMSGSLVVAVLGYLTDVHKYFVAVGDPLIESVHESQKGAASNQATGDKSNIQTFGSGNENNLVQGNNSVVDQRVITTIENLEISFNSQKSKLNVESDRELMEAIENIIVKMLQDGLISVETMQTDALSDLVFDEIVSQRLVRDAVRTRQFSIPKGRTETFPDGLNRLSFNSLKPRPTGSAFEGIFNGDPVELKVGESVNFRTEDHFCGAVLNGFSATGDEADFTINCYR